MIQETGIVSPFRWLRQKYCISIRRPLFALSLQYLSFHLLLFVPSSSTETMDNRESGSGKFEATKGHVIDRCFRLYWPSKMVCAVRKGWCLRDGHTMARRAHIDDISKCGRLWLTQASLRVRAVHRGRLDLYSINLVLGRTWRMCYLLAFPLFIENGALVTNDLFETLQQPDRWVGCSKVNWMDTG